MASMLRLYALVKPVIGFWEDTRGVVTIPRGSLLELMVRDQPVGVCNALWNGRWVFVFCEDVDRNGVIVENRQ